MSFINRIIDAFRGDAPPRGCPKDFVPVEMNGHTFWVAPDYLKDDRGVRIPTDARAALGEARIEGCTLPSRELVDAIWQRSDTKLDPQTMPATAAMTSRQYAEWHNQLIERQLSDKPRPHGLIAGHKKDILLSSRPDRVLIYGWHQLNGKPIQPPSYAHHWSYADYSHGVRLVWAGG